MEQVEQVEQVAYKVVTVRDNGLWSLMEMELEGCRVQYVRGQVAVPRIEGSKLFCFDTLENAMAQMDLEEDEVQLWTCLVTNPQPMYVRASTVYGPETFVKFWTLGDRTRVGPCPDGTLGVDSIQLVERVS